jgi:hypothetical protein
MDRYKNFSISRNQTQTLAFAIIESVEAYVLAHQAEFDEYLKNEERKEREKVEATNKSIADTKI